MPDLPESLKGHYDLLCQEIKKARSPSRDRNISATMENIRYLVAPTDTIDMAFERLRHAVANTQSLDGALSGFAAELSNARPSEEARCLGLAWL